MAAGQAPTDGSDPTSLWIASARSGDRETLNNLVERFTPVLLAQARYRMNNLLRGIEPEDIVQEVWAIALPKFVDLEPRDGRWTPVLLKFLAVILLRTVNDHVRKNLRRRGGNVGRGGSDASAADPLLQSPAEVTGIVTRLARGHRVCSVQSALQQLSPEDREVLVLRGIEQLPNGEVARLLGVDDSVITRRYQRALRQLAAALPASVLAELEPS